MMRACLCAVTLLAGSYVLPASAQQAVSPGDGAVLRVLDKVSGQTKSVEVSRGQIADIGSLSVAMRECRFPEGSPNRDAFAFLDITDRETAKTYFSGWMIASAPALNALEHSRYDVWVLKCITS